MWKYSANLKNLSNTLESEQAGVLKTVQSHILRCLGSRESVKTKVRIKLVETLTLPPTAYWILWLLRLGGDVLKTPLRYRGRSHFGLYIAIDHLLPGTYSGHMPKRY